MYTEFFEAVYRCASEESEDDGYGDGAAEPSVMVHVSRMRQFMLALEELLAFIVPVAADNRFMKYIVQRPWGRIPNNWYQKLYGRTH